MNSLGSSERIFRAYFSLQAWLSVWKHAFSSLAREVGGVLVGSEHYDDAGPYIDISASLRAESALEKRASLTFTHQTWQELSSRVENEYTGKSIIGWYHTHPGMGTFLSSHDCFIHSNFFSGPLYVALVVDPADRKHKLFRLAGKDYLESNRLLVYINVENGGEMETLSEYCYDRASRDRAREAFKKFSNFYGTLHHFDRVAVIVDNRNNILLPETE